MGVWLVSNWPVFIAGSTVVGSLAGIIAFVVAQAWKVREDRRQAAREAREVQKHEAEMLQLTQGSSRAAVDAAQTQANAARDEAEKLKERLSHHQSEVHRRADMGRLDFLRAMLLLLKTVFPRLGQARKQLQLINQTLRSTYAISDEEIVDALATSEPAHEDRLKIVRAVALLTRADANLKHVAPNMLRWFEFFGPLRISESEEASERTYQHFVRATEQIEGKGASGLPSTFAEMDHDRQTGPDPMQPLLNGSCFLQAIDRVVAKQSPPDP